MLERAPNTPTRLQAVVTVHVEHRVSTSLVDVERALCLAMVLGACGSAPLSPLHGRAESDAKRPSPTTRAPEVLWAETQFVGDGLPAITADGQQIVLGLVAEDGARGNPNLAIVIKDRGDRITKQLAVFAAGELDTTPIFNDRGMTTAVQARIAAANRLLGDLHRTEELVTLPRLSFDDEEPYGAGLRGQSEQLVVQLEPPRMLITSVDGQKLTERSLPESWLVEDRPMCSTCAEVCHNPPFLGAVWADPGRRVAVVKLSYRGTDPCLEPESQYHVVSW